MTADNAELRLMRLTAGIVAAHVSHNTVPHDGLPELIQLVYAALNSAGTAAPVDAQPQPAVPAKKSVFPDYIVCLEDGKKLKMLKRHLKTAYGLTPDAYRARWNLPATYPMVAPNYASHRSTLAKQIGLGRKARVDSAAAAPSQVPEVPVQHIPAGKRGPKLSQSKRVAKAKVEVEEPA